MITKTTPEYKAMKQSTPGAILKRRFLDPINVTPAELSRRTQIPASRLTEIIKGRRAITSETALKFSAFFGNSAQFWLNLQTNYDLRMTDLEIGDAIRTSVRPLELAKA